MLVDEYSYDFSELLMRFKVLKESTKNFFGVVLLFMFGTILFFSS
jgi:hypothetical protein